jgi:3-dehydroquinate synthetase
MTLDKKVQAGRVRFVLARKLGKVQIGCEVAPAVLEETLLGLNTGRSRKRA